MILVYLLRQYAHDRFEEAVVCAKSESDAASAVGVELEECLVVETIGIASDHLERGVVCWGEHDDIEDVLFDEDKAVGALKSPYLRQSF